MEEGTKFYITPPQRTEQEPFGYFKAEPFGWTDCSETDEGAKALYEAPPKRKPLTPQSPCEMTQAEGKMFKLGWLECEADHGIKEKNTNEND